MKKAKKLTAIILSALFLISALSFSANAAVDPNPYVDNDEIPFESLDGGEASLPLTFYGETYTYSTTLHLTNADGVYRGTFEKPIIYRGRTKNVVYSDYVIYRCPDKAGLLLEEPKIEGEDKFCEAEIYFSEFTEFQYKGGSLTQTKKGVTAGGVGTMTYEENGERYITPDVGIFAVDTFTMDENLVGDKDGTGHVERTCYPAEQGDDPGSTTLYLVAVGDYDVDDGVFPFEKMDETDVKIPIVGFTYHIDRIDPNTLIPINDELSAYGGLAGEIPMTELENAYLHISHVTGCYNGKGGVDPFKIYRVPADAEFWVEIPGVDGASFEIRSYGKYNNYAVSDVSTAAEHKTGEHFGVPDGAFIWCVYSETPSGVIDITGTEISDMFYTEDYIYLESSSDVFDDNSGSGGGDKTPGAAGTNGPSSDGAGESGGCGSAVSALPAVVFAAAAVAVFKKRK